MTADAIVLSVDTFQSLSQDVQAAIRAAVFGQPVAAKPPAGQDDDEIEGDENFVELSPAQARDLYNGCRERIRNVLIAIAKSNGPVMHLADIARAVGEEPPEMGGVWTGLTRRLRSVVGNPQAYLFDWETHKPKNDSKGRYIDHVFEVTPLTYHSLRKALRKLDVIPASPDQE